jgi:hypothetical protein
MNSLKLPLLFCLSLTAVACVPMGQYGGPAQPGAGAPSSAGGPTAMATDPTPASATEPTPAASPAAPSTVSVTIRSSCGKTVKIFYGDKPKFGSGTYSSASSNSRMSHTFRPGDQLWIVDDSQNGVDSVRVAESTREIEILGSCDRLAAR